MTAARYVTPAGVVIEMEPEAAEAIGYQPEQRKPETRRKAKED